jgi:hypothetical protein
MTSGMCASMLDAVMLREQPLHAGVKHSAFPLAFLAVNSAADFPQSNADRGSYLPAGCRLITVLFSYLITSFPTPGERG